VSRPDSERQLYLKQLERELYCLLQLDRIWGDVIERLQQRRARNRKKIEEARKVLAGQRLLFTEPERDRA
jgi:hypothetical protein